MPNPSVDRAFLKATDDDMSMSCDQAYTLYLRGQQRGQIEAQRKWIKYSAVGVFLAVLLGFTSSFMTIAWIIGSNRQQAAQQQPSEDLVIRFNDN